MQDLPPPVSRVGRPRVLLADDDAGILKAISRTLATDFDVVAAVSDGRQALDTVPLLDPDLVVLDVSMPGLNGFQTAAAMKRFGCRAKIVFLTMHQDDEFVAKAIRSGAAGYVLKTLAASELRAALRYALAGQQFLPSLAPLVMTDADAHAIQFQGDSSWLDGTADVLSRALHRGDVVATVFIKSNRDALAIRMHERGFNLIDLGAQGRYRAFDADEAATHLIRAGRLDLDSIAEMVAGLDSARKASTAGPRAHLTIIGEISAVLCRRGNPEAALALERAWDELTHPLPFLTICTYPLSCLDDEGTPGYVSEITACHSVVSHAVSAWRS